MTSKDFGIVEEAFQQALELDGDARQKFLKIFRKDYPTLIDTLNNLLRADANDADTLAEAVSTSIRTLADEANDPWIDREIGVWKIKNRIGAGGMGAVFLADRVDEQYSQSVAVKILGSQLLDSNAAIRFRTERQILANLNHPHIATLIDGGVTDTDLPYLVMEFVDGMRIDEYCDTNNLSIKDRIDLFKTVCEAVDFAHRNLVVHCDLKPSNILVTDDGVVKLLDFGIAKLIEPEEFDMTIALTAAGARVMTPEYASPEQVRGETVSTTTDVYALGVLLFRLLTGRSPYGNEFTTAHEIQSAILDTDPKRPSTIVSEAPTATMLNTPSTPDEISSLRGTSIDRLRKSLAGDLDTIILKCLQKDAERRYPSPRDIAADLTRFIQNEPILARGDSWRYKTGKFIRRNARAVMATAAVLAMTVSLVSFYTVRLADERDKAQLAAAEANQVSEFMTDIFDSASPRVDEGIPITARDLLNDANKKINALDGQQKLKANLYYTIGESQFWLGDYDKAKESYTNALHQQLTLSPQPHEKIVGTYLALADIEQVKGDYEASDAPLQNAMDIAMANFGENHKVTAHVISRMAATAGGKRNSEEALELFERAQKSLQAWGKKEEEIELEIYGNSMIYHGRLGQFDKAVEVGRQAVVLSEKILGPLDPDTIIRITNLSNSLRRQWRLEESLKYSQLGVRRAAQVWPQKHRQHRLPLRGHAINLEILGRFDEAKEARELENELAINAEGEGSSAHAQTLLGLARWHQQRGYLEKAVLGYQDALKFSVANDGDTAFFPTLCRLFLAETYNELDDYKRAKPLLANALSNERVLSMSLKTTLNIQRAEMLLGTNNKSQAIVVMNGVVAEKDKDGKENGPNIVHTFIKFIAFYREAGELEKAEGFAKRAYEAGKSSLPKDIWITALAGSELAQVLAAQGKAEEAKQIARPAYEVLLKTFGPDDYRVREIRSLLN